LAVHKERGINTKTDSAAEEKEGSSSDTLKEIWKKFGLSKEEFEKVESHHLSLKITETKSTGQVNITVTGNTFAYKEELKSIGCRWNRFHQGWSLPWGCQNKLLSLLDSLQIRPVSLPPSLSSQTPSSSSSSSSSSEAKDDTIIKEEPKDDPKGDPIIKEDLKPDPESKGDPIIKEEPKDDPKGDPIIKEEPKDDPIVSSDSKPDPEPQPRDDLSNE